MEWDLIEEENFGLEFTPIIFFFQFILFIFAIVYFLLVLVDVFSTKKKLRIIQNELKEKSDMKSAKEYLFAQKVKYRWNKLLSVFIDHLLFCGENMSQIEVKAQQERLFSFISEKTLKYILILRWMAIFSYATTFYLIYDQITGGYGMDKIFLAIIIPLLAAIFFVSSIYLKKRFSEILEKSATELQLVLLKMTNSEQI
jgi:hypothetical protein